MCRFLLVKCCFFDVCCLAQETAFRSPVTSSLHMRSAPSLSFLRLVGQPGYVIPVTTSILIATRRELKSRVLLLSIELNTEPNSLVFGNGPNRQCITRASSLTFDQPLLPTSPHQQPLTSHNRHHTQPEYQETPTTQQSKIAWQNSQQEPLPSSRSSLQESRLGQLSPWPSLPSPSRHHSTKSPHLQQRTPRMRLLVFPCSLTQSARAHADIHTYLD